MNSGESFLFSVRLDAGRQTDLNALSSSSSTSAADKGVRQCRFLHALRVLEVREWAFRGGVWCRRLRHGIPHGGTEGTEERVPTCAS